VEKKGRQVRSSYEPEINPERAHLGGKSSRTQVYSRQQAGCEGWKKGEGLGKKKRGKEGVYVGWVEEKELEASASRLF